MTIVFVLPIDNTIFASPCDLVVLVPLAVRGLALLHAQAVAEVPRRVRLRLHLREVLSCPPAPPGAAGNLEMYLADA